MGNAFGRNAFGGNAFACGDCAPALSSRDLGERSAMRTNYAIHLRLMLLAFAAAYLVPFELLLLAYVALGPSHYFTEISWLHYRSYFLPRRRIAVALHERATDAALVDDAS